MLLPLELQQNLLWCNSVTLINTDIKKSPISTSGALIDNLTITTCVCPFHIQEKSQNDSDQLRIEFFNDAKSNLGVYASSVDCVVKQ